MPNFSLVAAMGLNRVIGHSNQMPWKKMSADLKHFKQITMDKPIIMGRKTFQSIGTPLPGRENIILSRDKTLKIVECSVIHSVDEALKIAEKHNETMIVGGAQIYALFLPFINKIYLTVIHQIFNGDAFLPKWNEEEWKEISRVNYTEDEKNPYPYSFIELRKK